MKIHLKKILVSFFVVAGFVLYGLYQHFFNVQQNTSENSQASSSITTQIAANEPASETMKANSTTTDIAAATDTASSGSYKDGQYKGSPADASYGIVQVNAIIERGKLVDVQFLSYPDNKSYSVELNKYAMPILTAEALKAQSANVDIVTGATMTTEAFIISLNSALEQAKV